MCYDEKERCAEVDTLGKSSKNLNKKISLILGFISTVEPLFRLVSAVCSCSRNRE